VNADKHLRANFYCAAEVLRSRQRTGEPVPAWLRQHHRQLDTAFRMSQSGHENCSDAGQLEKEKDVLITAREAAELLRKSKRQCQRLASDLGGQIVGGRWLFSRAAVVEYAEGINDA
jgi:hypothetical protein